jgi:multicomponent Na+:H+ antiporter subunit D
MPQATALPIATTPDGYLLVLAIMLPVVGILLSLVLGRLVERIALVLMALGFAVAAAVFATVWQSGRPLVYVVGGWAPPLGIALRADGLSAAMMMTTAIIICATGLFARGEFGRPPRLAEARGPLVFWILLLAIWSALNAIVVGNDLFNLYVALELLTFAAVPLVCLKGSAATVAAALRYILFALLGSILYLLGAVIIYGAYGTLDITLLSGRVAPQSVAAAIAAALMTIGLLANTALFPCTCGCRRRMPVRRLPVARCSRRSSSRALSS